MLNFKVINIKQTIGYITVNYSGLETQQQYVEMITVFLSLAVVSHRVI